MIAALLLATLRTDADELRQIVLTAATQIGKMKPLSSENLFSAAVQLQGFDDRQSAELIRKAWDLRKTPVDVNLLDSFVAAAYAVDKKLGDEWFTQVQPDRQKYLRYNIARSIARKDPDGAYEMLQGSPAGIQSFAVLERFYVSFDEGVKFLKRFEPNVSDELIWRISTGLPKSRVDRLIKMFPLKSNQYIAETWSSRNVDPSPSELEAVSNRQTQPYFRLSALVRAIEGYASEGSPKAKVLADELCRSEMKNPTPEARGMLLPRVGQVDSPSVREYLAFEEKIRPGIDIAATWSYIDLGKATQMVDELIAHGPNNFMNSGRKSDHNYNTFLANLAKSDGRAAAKRLSQNPTEGLPSEGQASRYVFEIAQEVVKEAADKHPDQAIAFLTELSQWSKWFGMTPDKVVELYRFDLDARKSPKEAEKYMRSHPEAFNPTNSIGYVDADSSASQVVGKLAQKDLSAALKLVADIPLPAARSQMLAFAGSGRALAMHARVTLLRQSLTDALASPPGDQTRQLAIVAACAKDAWTKDRAARS